MLLDYSSLMDDVQKILKTSNKKIRHNHKAMLHTVKSDFYAISVQGIDLVRDYVENFGDLRYIDISLPLGTYTYKLYPFRDNLELSIETETLSEVGGRDNKSVPVSIERFKAVLAGNFPNPVKSGVSDTNEDTLNSTIVDLKLQLICRSLEPLRIKTTHGIIKEHSYFDVVHGILGGESFKTIVDGKPSIDGIDIVEFDNKEPQQHIVLPSNLRIVNLTTVLQNRMGGLYYNGVGTYLQVYRKKKFWFVYPLWDTGRYMKHKVPKMHVYVVPQQRFPELDNTFKIENPDLLEIICNEGKRYIDDANNAGLDKGVGIRSANSMSFMTSNEDKRLIKMTPNGPVAQRKLLNYEMNSGDRNDRLNYSPTGKNEINSNPFYEYSNLAKQNCGRVEVTWQHCDITHVYPNMPVRVFFLEDDTVKILDGVVNRIHMVSTLEGNLATARRHAQKCVMHINCNYIEAGDNKDKRKLGTSDRKMPEKYPVVENKEPIYR